MQEGKEGLRLMSESSARTANPIKVIVFPGGHNWPIWVAQEKRFFERNHALVSVTGTPSSLFQMTKLIDGEFHIAMTAIDNVVAYVEGQGEADIASRPDLVVFMGGDNGFLSLVSLPEVKSIQDLKGKAVSVDALTTGYAFVLLDLLKRGGLTPADYKVERTGGVLERWNALKQKKHAGTMLITPFDIIAKSIGFNVLQKAIDVYGHYQGVVGATRPKWAAQNPEKVRAYIRGYVAGLEWLHDSNNKDEAIAILRKNLPQMSPELAAQSYAVLAGPKGFTPGAALDLEGVRTVLELRREYGKPKNSLSDPMKYYDPSYYETAVK